MPSNDELACVYGALILQDDEIAVTAEKISTILKAAGVEVEPYWPGLFAKALEGLDLKSLISNVGSGIPMCVFLLLAMRILSTPLSPDIRHTRVLASSEPPGARRRLQQLMARKQAGPILVVCLCRQCHQHHGYTIFA
ncbi:hypothetical protein MRX96_010952 [Rhipicephalus microplus]